MWPWSRKRKPEGEVSEGGSKILRHGGNEFNKPQFGVPDEASVEFAEKREAAYDNLFGKSAHVWHELLPLVPHIDVYRFPPGFKGRDYYTLATSGMSNFRMKLPPGIDIKYARAELIFYCTEPKDDYAELLRRIAHFPHDNNTWLGPGHTMPNGTPPAPVFGSAALDSFMFIPTIVSPDKDLPNKIKLDADPVSFLWVVPITTAECELKLRKGTSAILDLFNRFEHPFVFSGDRRSYV